MALYLLLIAVPRFCIPTMQASAMNVMRSAYSTRSWPSSSRTKRVKQSLHWVLSRVMVPTATEPRSSCAA